MSETTIAQDIEAQRVIRRARRQALVNFAVELGFNPDDVHSITAIDGVIRVGTLVRGADGEHLTFTNQDGHQQIALAETGLYTMESDLNDMLENLKRTDGFEAFMNGEPVEGITRGTVRE